jgi:uncharacterized ParB-like nuclease family protein
MHTTYCRVGDFYPFPSNLVDNVEVVDLRVIRPLVRSVGTNGFRKYKMACVLMAFQDPNGALPPIEIRRIESDPNYSYELIDGFHRYYASIAVGYTKIPAHIGVE